MPTHYAEQLQYCNTGGYECVRGIKFIKKIIYLLSTPYGISRNDFRLLIDSSFILFGFLRLGSTLW